MLVQFAAGESMLITRTDVRYSRVEQRVPRSCQINDLFEPIPELPFCLVAFNSLLANIQS